MRVQEWGEVNARALVSVDHSPEQVELKYGLNGNDEWLPGVLNELVAEEQDCCGAAGVAFETILSPESISVVVKVVRAGLPSATVVATFSEMNPSK